MSEPSSSLHRRDVAVLLGFCVLLFGISLISGRYLTMHEAVLPQSAREMYTTGEWVVPTSAGRPWIERPPLPQWITIAVAHVIGRMDAEWIVRIPPMLMASLAVLVVASLAARWYGRSIGVLAGLSLATMFEFTRYAWLAEQDIFLCAIVTTAIGLFCRAEWNETTTSDARMRFFGNRPISIWAFFVALAMTNLAKGILFGTAMAAIPLAAFLLWNRDANRIKAYFWFWGGLIWLATALAWPLAVLYRHPSAADLWIFDHVGRLTGDYKAINQPAWYYWANLPVVTLPWFPVALLGLASSFMPAVRQGKSPERFLLCWAFAPIIVFSFAGGKHHHYMLHFLAPWAVWSAIGLRGLRQYSFRWPATLKSPLAGALFIGTPLAIGMGLLGAHVVLSPSFVVASILGVVLLSVVLPLGLHHRRAIVSATSLFAFAASILIVGYLYVGTYFDECRSDTRFLKQAHKMLEGVPEPVIVNADLGTMDVFRILFYLGDNSKPIHNLTMLKDVRWSESPHVYVVSRGKDAERLSALGRVTVVAQAEETRRERTPGDRFTLMKLEFRRDLAWLPNDTYVSPMQAMDRAPGPFLGE